MHAIFCTAVSTLLVVATLPQAHGSPSYTYATGDNLNVRPNAQGFFGIRDLLTLDQASSPLDFKTVKPLKPTSPSRHFRMSSVQTTEEYNSAFTISAEAQGSYGGFSGSASAKYVQSKTLTSTSSLYMMFYEKQLGTIYLNPDAKLSQVALKLLKNDPASFVAAYGHYYIYGVTVGCQASSTVTITAKSEHDKKSLDVAAKASYEDMFSASAHFTENMEKQSGFSHLTVEVFTYGGDVPAVVTTIPEVKSKILDPLDSGAKCTADNALVSRALIRSWLAMPAVTDAIAGDPQIIRILTPQVSIPPHVLARMNNVIMRTRMLLKLADKCHRNVFGCVTKQWDEPTAGRQKLYTKAVQNLTDFQSKVDQANEQTLADPRAVLRFQQQLEDIYLKWLKPAEALTAFTFQFNIRVLNWYDDYQDPPPYGTNNLKGNFKIDPNRENTEQTITWATKPQIDNGHANCRHFYGHFLASYKDAQLSVSQIWSRVCGSSDKTVGPVVFYPGGDNSGTTDYDDTVRTAYSFTVKYDDPIPGVN